MTHRPNIRDLSLPEIEAFIANLGKEKYRARQIMKWLYQSGATSFAEMTTLARDFRARMEELFIIAEPSLDRSRPRRTGPKKPSSGFPTASPSRASSSPAGTTGPPASPPRRDARWVAVSA